MKKLLLICSWSLSVLAVAQVNEKPYEFPVKPGTEQWAKISTSREMDSVCVIPVGVLKGMSTNSLLITCLNYPRIFDFFLVDNMQAGFDFYAKHFNGLTELLTRSDLNEVLLQTYFNIDLINSKMVNNDTKLSHLQTAFFELLISQESIIDKYDQSKKQLLLKEALRKLDQRQILGESSFRQRTSALILSRILNSENKLYPFKDKNGNDIAKIFNSAVFLTNSQLIEKLIEGSKNLY